MESGGFMDAIGRDNFFLSKTGVLTAVYKKLNREVCLACPKRVFLECAGDPALNWGN